MPQLELPPSICYYFSEGKSENTIKTYLIMLLKLHKELFHSTTIQLDKIINNPKSVEDYLKNQTITTRKIISIALVMLLKSIQKCQLNGDKECKTKITKDIIDTYGKIARQYRIEDYKHRFQRPLTQQEKEGNIGWEAIIKKREKLNKMVHSPEFKKSNSMDDKIFYFLQYLLLSLYTYIPPQRGQVYYSALIDPPSNKRNTNYIDTANKEIVIKEHKTKKSFGTRTIALPQPLLKVIKEWQRINPCYDYHLICNNNNEKMSAQSYTTFLNKIFDKPISTDQLRKLYVTNIIKTRELTKDEIKDLAKSLGHSVTTLKHYYIKDF